MALAQIFFDDVEAVAMQRELHAGFADSGFQQRHGGEPKKPGSSSSHIAISLLAYKLIAYSYKMLQGGISLKDLGIIVFGMNDGLV